MARRDRVQISLFPFMSILACTIGALMFLLVTLAMSRVEASGALAAQRELPEPASPAAAQARAQVAQLESELELLLKAKERLAELDRQLEARGLDASGSLIGIRDRLDRIGQSEALTQELARLQAESEQIERARGEVETSISVLETRRKTLPILIDPTSLSRPQSAYFVECDRGGATAYRVRDDFEYFVPQADLSTSGEFGRYLRRIRALPGALMVLLVREDGIATSNKVEGLARNAGIRVARLPLPGKGSLDFRLLRAAEGEGG